jgi:hypothetical protein
MYFLLIVISVTSTQLNQYCTCYLKSSLDILKQAVYERLTTFVTVHVVQYRMSSLLWLLSIPDLVHHSAPFRFV